MAATTREKPACVIALERIYGGPGENGFGSAVFYQAMDGSEDLTRVALSVYRAFVGGLWERFGEPAWMGPWREVYARAPGTHPDIAAQLRGIADAEARRCVPLLLDMTEDAESARAALSRVFDDPAVSELRVFNLGDGEAMSGLLVAGRRESGGDAVLLAVLMD